MGAMTALVRETSRPAVDTTHKGDPLLLLNPPPKSLSVAFRVVLWESTIKCMYPYPMDLNLSPSPYISRLD